MAFDKLTGAAALAATLLIAPFSAHANDYEAQIKARQGQMQLIALNLGVLAEMAKGSVDFNAEAAQMAADNLVAVSMIGPELTWPEGSKEGSRASETVWTQNADFLEKWAALQPAAEALALVASTDAAAIGAALGPVGGTCSACHRAHRVRE